MSSTEHTLPGGGDDTSPDQGSSIAIIGLSGRFPRARTIDAFWQNLRDGVECVSFFNDDEIEPPILDAAVVNDPRFVKAAAILDDIELFDHEFFGFSPREAAILDPQHRLFLECAWEALEQAGYTAGTQDRSIGVYGGVSRSTYMLNLYTNPDLLHAVGPLPVMIGTDKDFLTTLVSYKLNLRGPSLTVQTACSTSLVAVHLACQSLLNGECDVALAGGASIGVPQKAGYLYQEEGVLSPDGHCRAFDASARGTVGGSGAGVVVLKRLDDAVADGDTIHAIIRGSAVNNDGAAKVGYSAPSLDGQSRVIAEAHAIAGVDPAMIGYVEAHGTGTPLGDPIEIAALTRVFRARTNKTGFCAIGSVKTNVGHSDAAAGITGLIKTVLALKHRMLPPSLHFSQPNPQIDFASTPFYVNAELRSWETAGFPRQAGVSAFGIGGTNAHVVLEEAPAGGQPQQTTDWQLLLLSAKTATALDTITNDLAGYLAEHRDVSLADVAYTLQVGRRAFEHRRMLVCHDVDDALAALTPADPRRILSSVQPRQDPSIVFMLPGLGDQYVNMARGLYQSESRFRSQVDRCCEILKPLLGRDLREVLFAAKAEAVDDGRTAGAATGVDQPGPDIRKMLGRAAQAERKTLGELDQTELAQPAVFVIEYALARLWMAWGVRPHAMIGHSLGEFVAACLAGVFSLEDALALVARRAQLIQQLPSSAMLAVPLSEEELTPHLNHQLSISALNSPRMSVIGGPIAAIEELEQHLAAAGTAARRVQTTHAFHSQMMEPIKDRFVALVKSVPLQAPQIPYLSNVTGTWITPEEATDPHYWAQHLCRPVRFADGVHVLLQEPGRIFLEVGPGQTLSTFVAQAIVRSNFEPVVLPSLRHEYERQSDTAFVLHTAGRLWLAGVEVQWSRLHARSARQRLPLPTYPFERQRHWIDARPLPQIMDNTRAAAKLRRTIDGWCYIPSWKRSTLSLAPGPEDDVRQDEHWLLFTDERWGSGLAERLHAAGRLLTTVVAGDGWTQKDNHHYILDPRNPDDYHRLLRELPRPTHVVHCWSLNYGSDEADAGQFDTAQRLGFNSLVLLAQALVKQHVSDVLDLWVVSHGVHAVTGDEPLSSERATILGACRVIGQEYPQIACRNIDLTSAADGPAQYLLDQLAHEFKIMPTDPVIAYRGRHRWLPSFDQIDINERSGHSKLHHHGVYLVIRGLENIGLVLAEHLAQAVSARLVLTTHHALPPRLQWEAWLAAHDDTDDISRAIRAVQLCEAAGAEVLLISIDHYSVAAIQAALVTARNHFGVLHGVIYTPAYNTAELLKPISDTPIDVYQEQLRARYAELCVLAEAVSGQQLDFCLLISSLASVLGGPGLAGYTAASHLTDVFAHSANAKDQLPWLTLNWDRSASPEEAKTVIHRLISAPPATQVVVSTIDLALQIDRWVKLGGLQEQATTAANAAATARTNLSNPYVAPTNEAEQMIVNIMHELIGVNQIGTHDNFFQLGVNSLLGIQFISQLRKAFGIDLPLRTLFEAPTVVELALAIEDIVLTELETENETIHP